MRGTHLNIAIKVREVFGGVVFSFHHVGPGELTPGVTCLYLPSAQQGNAERPEYRKNISGHIFLFDSILQNHLSKYLLFFFLGHILFCS